MTAMTGTHDDPGMSHKRKMLPMAVETAQQELPTVRMKRRPTRSSSEEQATVEKSRATPSSTVHVEAFICTPALRKKYTA
ncbi:hypothetical protein E2C01_023702 [Portunus trituberculatus]|uniref:Uncharacterized protein n=1 Tax=Portunus trituberculatus TaxID=210409 RepID=A0A5B7EAP1_PORTR|nr:hypothetical protein [Portunus trituberculatus]